MSGPIADKIRTRGYWRVVIRPTTFQTRVNSFEKLASLVESCSVQMRGWDFPHISERADRIRGHDWVGQDIDWGGLPEVWRAYQSGQFVDLAAFLEDWLDESQFIKPSPNWQPRQEIHIEDIIWRYTEIFEFAARWAMTDAGSEQMQLKVEVHGLQGRGLTVWDPRRMGIRYRRDTAQIPDWKSEIAMSREELVATGRQKAQQWCADLFMHFGWEPQPSTIADWQEQLLSRK